jgi:hypothetical protein
LKRYLDVPIIGLQSPSLSGLAAPDSMTALAAAHADRIAAVAPNGPIRLLGWSFGRRGIGGLPTLWSTGARPVRHPIAQSLWC